MLYEWDDNKAAGNQTKHGISFEEVRRFDFDTSVDIIDDEETEERWKSLGNPELSEDVVSRIIDGVKAETAGRSIADLAAERDEGLLRLLEKRTR